MDCHVARAIGNTSARCGKAFVIGVGHTGHRVGIISTWESENHVEVNTKQSIAIGLAETTSHDGSPIPALGDVAVVTELFHQFRNCIGNTIHMKFRLHRWSGESVTGH